MFTHWYCTACSNESTEQHAKDADVSTVANQIAQKHKWKSPQCHDRNAMSAIRVGFPPKLSDAPKEGSHES